MSLVIKPAQNGWLLVYSEEGEQDRLYVFSHDDSEEEEAKAFQALLYAVNDTYGPTSSRYSEHRIYITVAPGDKNSKHPNNQEESEDGDSK